MTGLPRHPAASGGQATSPGRLRDHASEIALRLLEADSGVLALDFDGTLTEIVDDPKAPRLSPERRDVLARVAAIARLRVTVLSGRALRDVSERIGVPAVTVVGNHGLEIEGWSLPEAEAARPELEAFLASLEDPPDLPFPILVEDKGATATIHARGRHAAEERDLLREALQARLMQAWVRGPSAVPAAATRLRLHLGKDSVEVRPAVSWDKARALVWLLEGWGAGPRHAFYAGDDVTDECVFEALREGITVKVGEGSSAARYVAEGPEEVYGFLRELLRLAGRVGAAVGAPHDL